jgi:Domain of unknown function (DUF397)
MEQPYNGISTRELAGVEWRHSRRSSPNGNCVEIAKLPGELAAVRDSKDPHGPALIFGATATAVFITNVRSGIFTKVVP